MLNVPEGLISFLLDDGHFDSVKVSYCHGLRVVTEVTGRHPLKISNKQKECIAIDFVLYKLGLYLVHCTKSHTKSQKQVVRSV